MIPCPFCARTNLQLGGSGEDGEPNYVVCMHCKAEGPYTEKGAEAAKRMWDQRFDGRYGITARELDDRIVAHLKDLMLREYGCRPWWLDNPNERPLEQSISMCVSYAMSDAEQKRLT